MRKGIATSLILVLACPVATAFEVEFATPATIEGASTVSGTQWLALRLPAGAEVQLAMQGAGRVVETNVTYHATVTTPATFFESPPFDTSSSFALVQQKVTLRAAPGGATLAIAHEGMIATQGRMVVAPLETARGTASLVDEGGARPVWSSWSKENGAGVALQGPKIGIQLRDLPVDAVEWFNMDVACSAAGDCPSGGGPYQIDVAFAGTTASSTSHVFERLEAPALLTAHLPSVAMAVGGATLDVSVDGRVHLPVAAGTTCPDCPPLQDQTLALSGEISLTQVRHSGDGFVATVDGRFDSARIDETWVSPESLRGASAMAVAVVGAGLLLKLGLAPLFTRLSKQEALEHPKRQSIFAYVQEHPGANFREVARSTGIAAGTVRHHLTVLERAGHLVERQHLGTVRLFENHGKFDHNWADVVFLREPPLAQVHDWLKEHVGSPQKSVLEAFEKQGWSRSTTQHRLARLVEGGLVSIRLQGRLKIYSVVERVAFKATLASPAMPGMLPLA